MTENNMELKASDGKGFVKEKRPRIKKGYYIGILKEFKPIVDKDGKDVEGKFGKQAVILFYVYDNSKSQIMIDNKPLVIAKTLYTQYKNKDGTYGSAITKGSQTTKVLKALGWEFAPNKELDTNTLIGVVCELNIDDYEAKWTEEDGKETTYKASSVKDINPLEENEDGTITHTVKPVQTITMAELDVKLKNLTDLKDKGAISQQGYDMAVEQLSKIQIVD